MARSPLDRFVSLSVPLHLNILGWGVIALAIYALAPEILASSVVMLGLILFAMLYTVVAMILLVVKLGAPGKAAQVDGMSWSAVGMALAGAAMLLAVSYAAGETAGRAMAMAAPAVGLVCGGVGLVALQRRGA